MYYVWECFHIVSYVVVLSVDQVLSLILTNATCFTILPLAKMENILARWAECLPMANSLHKSLAGLIKSAGLAGVWLVFGA